MPNIALVCLLVFFGSLSALKLPEGIAAGGNNIVIYGDSQTNGEVHRKVVQGILEFHPTVVFHTGDLVQNGNDPQDWGLFNSITKELRSKAEFYPSMGNHDNNSQLFFDNFTLPNNEQWYSLERQGIHFVILDMISPLHAGSEQYRWLEDDLKNASKNVRFKIVIFHYPLFSVSRHGSDELGLKEDLFPLFAKYGVSAVFSGHDHTYQRFLYQGVYFIVNGGGGGHLYDKERDSPYLQKFVKEYHFCVLTPKDDKISVAVYDLNRNLIDHFELRGDIH